MKLCIIGIIILNEYDDIYGNAPENESSPNKLKLAEILDALVSKDTGTGKPNLSNATLYVNTKILLLRN